MHPSDMNRITHDLAKAPISDTSHHQWPKRKSARHHHDAVMEAGSTIPDLDDLLGSSSVEALGR